MKRAVCQVCKDKEKCSYVLWGNESDCIDVQTSDYGYEEATERAVQWLARMLDEQGFARPSVERIVYDFQKEMEV